MSVFLFMLVVTARAENTNISSQNIKKMNNEELIQLFLEGNGFSEITERIRENNSDQNEELGKLLLRHWKESSDAGLVKARCLQGLRLVKSQEAVDYFITQLFDGETKTDRVLAAHQLGILKNASAVPALEYAVSTDRGKVAAEAISALGKIGEPAVPSLMRIWEDKGLRVGCEERIISAIGYTKDIRFRPILLNVLEGKDDLGRDNAARILGEIGDATVLPELKKYQNDSNKQVKENVLEAISKIEQRVQKEEK